MGTVTIRDVANYHSLSNVKEFEWQHLKLKCRELRLENIFIRFLQLISEVYVARFVLMIEILMVLHIILLLSLVKNLHFTLLLPYVTVMIILPALMVIRISEENSFTADLVVSWLMALFLTLADIIVPIFELVSDPLVPCYDHVVILSVYTLLPVAFLKRGMVYLLGFTVSLIYIGYMFWMLSGNSRFVYSMFVCYILYHLFLNLVMMFFNVVREFYDRRELLYKYQLLHQRLTFKMEKEKEKTLLESILPGKLAHLEDDSEISGRPSFRSRKIFIEPHSKVSILVAQMVNYTQLTTTQMASDLVDIFHELFMNFDVAAKKNRTMRIKFQSESYNCVAGIPEYFPSHANSCVDQALDMIRITEELSNQKNLNINLRIGVHSGEVLAGIIGHSKRQLDIWSQDVDITNRLESSGQPGLVHVSKRTMALLDDCYVFEKVTESSNMDSILQEKGISTYLISGRMPDQMEQSDVKEELDKSTMVNSNQKGFEDLGNEIQIRAHREMIQEVERMAVGVQCNWSSKASKMRNCAEYLFDAQVWPLFYTFRSWTREWKFFIVPDLMMKYSMVMVLIAGIILVSMDVVETNNAMLFLLILPLLILCLISVFKKLWLQKGSLATMSESSFFLCRWLLKISTLIEDSLFVRVPLLILVMGILYYMTSQRVFSCDIALLEMEIIDADLRNDLPAMLCFLPWTVTYSVVLVLSLLFFFIGIPAIIKILVGLAILGCHLGTIHLFYGFAFERSETTNLGLNADWAHTWYLVLFFILLVLREHHVTYGLRSTFFLRMCYEKKQEEIQASSHTIKVIMAKLLPFHVAEVFQQFRTRDHLYYENFNQVAVMFASIESFQADIKGLRELHEYICFFDDLLGNFQSTPKIEKIKVMGWTYMAACGLMVDHNSDFSVAIPEARMRSGENPLIDNETNQSASLEQNEDICVLVMTEFALRLLRIMHEIRIKGMDLDHDAPTKTSLKIGISHGPVMAGVVGLSKPHYDLWGHTVNMAFRLTSTGVQDSIHVSTNTAFVLQQSNIRCNYWDMMGEEEPTYLVALDHSPEDHSDEIQTEDFQEEAQNKEEHDPQTGERSKSEIY